jgi:hypothetical protein
MLVMSGNISNVLRIINIIMCSTCEMLVCSVHNEQATLPNPKLPCIIWLTGRHEDINSPRITVSFMRGILRPQNAPNWIRNTLKHMV